MTTFPILTLDPGKHAGVGYGYLQESTLFATVGYFDLKSETPVGRPPELALNIVLTLSLSGLPTPKTVVLTDSTQYSRSHAAKRSQLLQIGYLYGFFNQRWAEANVIVDTGEISNRLRVTGGRRKADVVTWARTKKWVGVEWMTDHELDALVSLFYWASLVKVIDRVFIKRFNEQ